MPAYSLVYSKPWAKSKIYFAPKSTHTYYMTHFKLANNVRNISGNYQKINCMLAHLIAYTQSYIVIYVSYRMTIKRTAFGGCCAWVYENHSIIFAVEYMARVSIAWIIEHCCCWYEFVVLFTAVMMVLCEGGGLISLCHETYTYMVLIICILMMMVFQQYKLENLFHETCCTVAISETFVSHFGKLAVCSMRMGNAGIIWK